MWGPVTTGPPLVMALIWLLCLLRKMLNDLQPAEGVDFVPPKCRPLWGQISTLSLDIMLQV